VGSLDKYAATELLSETEACAATGVKFARILEHEWRLKHNALPAAKLSPPMGKFPLLKDWACTNSDLRGCIQRLRTSEYTGSPDAEASVRLIVELLLHDRSDHLEDQASRKLLKFCPEVAIRFHEADKIISRRADWTICHGDSRQGQSGLR
jgi:hypothetical protein